MAERQLKDAEIGTFVSLRLTQEQPPEKAEIQSESEFTKQLVSNWDRFEIHNGLVYRRHHDTPRGEGDYLQLLLPRADVPETLRLCHEGIVGGHFAERKTLDQVGRRFYWNHWQQYVARFCRQCPQCSRYHQGKLRKQGPLQPVIPGAPFERWYIDLTGPHPKSANGHLWILTCMDSFTKWAEAFPLRSKEAEPIAKILVEQVFSRFGIPLSILSDQGKEVDGRIMREVCGLFGVEKLRTTPYKPSTNQVERFHRTLNSILGKTVAEHQKDWDSRLVFALSAYRATRHRGTGYSPNFLVLGRETRAPPDLVHGHVEEGDEYDAFVTRLCDRLTEAYAEVRQQLRQSAGYNKRYYDIGVRPSRFEAGQWVWYYNPRKYPGRQMKWTQQYEGPYLVLKMLSPLVAKIQQSSRNKPKTVHIDKLKKYEGIAPRMWPTAIVAVDAQRDGGQKGVTDPYAVLLGVERSILAESARASGEVHLCEGRESVDGLTAPPLAQKTGNVQELLCPEQTQSLEPLVPIDGSASHARILTETSGHNCEFGPPAVTEPDAVEDSSRFVLNDSEATTPVATHAVEETGVYSNSGLGSSIIITVNKSAGAPYPVTSPVAGDSIYTQGGNGDTNVTTPVAATEHGIQAGQWASDSYENSAISVCEKTSDVEHRREHDSIAAVMTEIMGRGSTLILMTVVQPGAVRSQARTGCCCLDQQSE